MLLMLVIMSLIIGRGKRGVGGSVKHDDRSQCAWHEEGWPRVTMMGVYIKLMHWESAVG